MVTPPTPDTQVSEWVKASISTTVGFVAAAVLEPLKLFFSDVRARRSLRRALYIEMAHNIYTVDYIIDSADKSISYTQTWIRALRTDVYQHAKQSPGIFYQLKDADVIERFFVAINGIELNYSSFMTLRDDADICNAVVKSGMATGELDAKYLLKVASPPAVTVIQQLQLEAEKEETRLNP